MTGTLAALVVGASILAPTLTATAAPDAEPSGQADAPGGSEAGVRETADGALDVTRDDATGRVEFVRVTKDGADLAPTADSPSARGSVPRPSDKASDKASDWLAEHSMLFGVPDEQLELTDEITDAFGDTLTYSQTYDDVPVWGAALKANVDSDGHLVSLNGRVTPDLDLDTTPHDTATHAANTAIALVRADPPTDHDGEASDTTGLTATATPVIYEVGSPLGQAGPTYLAWQAVVMGGEGLREQVILADRTGKVLNRYSDVHGLTRQLDTYTGISTFGSTWSEGDSTAGLTQAQRNLLDTSEESYHFFNTTFGRNSYDDAGTLMTVRDNRMTECPNASWHGSYVSVCPGLESDDIMAHEWGHAYTQFTSGLIYQYQPGALNESYSDVWGETVDLLNGREDQGGDNSIRSDDSCIPGPEGVGTSVAISIVSPRSLAGPCTSGARGSNSAYVDGPQTVAVAVAKDGTNATGLSTTDACTAVTNQADVAGRWAYVDRGTCTFQIKADNLIAAGATGILIGNNTTGTIASAKVTSTLPVLTVTTADGNRFKALPTGAAAKVRLNAPLLTNQRRWLVGEKAAPAMGGALRDMWNPRCAGNAAAVTDAEYFCETGDNGGVHYNSGVPNRAYSLFVDGGTFNGHTVAGVGLDRAAHVWWRANTAHLIPTSNFADFADALTQSCGALVGEPLTPLSVEAPGVGPVTPVSALTETDCAGLGEVIEATELRTDITERCDYTPVFTPGEPASACGPGTTKVEALSEDFEAGATGWTGTVTPVPGGNVSSWGLNTGLARNPGTAAFVSNPGAVCTPSSAGVSSLYSPTVALGADALSPRLRFRHQVGLEALYDGANVKVSINGGAFTQPPAAAWLHNSPAQTIQPWNTGSGDNPMLGERVWNGYDQATLGAVWGTSVLDLAAAGALPGNSVVFRFDLGTDQCGGLYGWGVDDISLTWCEADDLPVARDPEPAATPSPTGDPLLPTETSDPEAADPDAAGAATPEASPSPQPSPRSETTTVLRTPAPGVRRGRAFTLTAAVRGADGGQVHFLVGGKRVGTATVLNGQARLRVTARQTRTIRSGQREVTARFSGSTTAKPSKARTTLRFSR